MSFVRLGAGAALAFLIAAGCSHGEPQEQTGTTAQAVQDGFVDQGHKYAVGLCIGNRGQCFGGICSGTLVTPNLVITARHCVDNTPAQIRCDQSPVPVFGNRKGGTFWVTTHYQMTGQNTLGWHSVKQVLVPTDDTVCGNDIALLVLNDLVDKSEAEPAVPGVQYPMGDARYAGRYAAIGYGNTGPNTGGSGTRRNKEDIRLACIPGDKFIDCPAQAQVNPREFVGGDGICSGDSGSGAFEMKSYGDPFSPDVSFGVLSRGGEDDTGTKCVGSIYTRLDKWRDFVVQGADLASDGWKLYPKPLPDWTIYVPPPSEDAGAKDAAPPKPSNLGFGEACADDGECASGVCTDSVCGQTCEEGAADTCPEGYACSGGLCVVAPEPAAPAAATTTTTKSGCSVALDPTQPIPWLWVTGAAVALAVARRRRRS